MSLILQDRDSAYGSRGAAWYYKNDYDRAIADYTAAIDIDPNDARVYQYRGRAWHDRREYARAIADYTTAIGINPTYALAYYTRGLARQAAGDKVGGDADIARARELQPGIGP